MFVNCLAWRKWLSRYNATPPVQTHGNLGGSENQKPRCLATLKREGSNPRSAKPDPGFYSVTLRRAPPQRVTQRLHERTKPHLGRPVRHEPRLRANGQMWSEARVPLSRKREHYYKLSGAARRSALSYIHGLRDRPSLTCSQQPATIPAHVPACQYMFHFRSAYFEFNW